MKKIYLIVYASCLIFLGLITLTNVKAANSVYVYFHYYRFDQTSYSEWQIHSWETGKTGIDYQFDSSYTSDTYKLHDNERVAKIPFNVDDFSHTTNFNFVIIKKANATVHDATPGDRTVDLKWVDRDPNDNYHIYAVQDQVVVGKSLEEVHGNQPDTRVIKNLTLNYNNSTSLVDNIVVKKNSSIPAKVTIYDYVGMEYDSSNKETNIPIHTSDNLIVDLGTLTTRTLTNKDKVNRFSLDHIYFGLIEIDSFIEYRTLDYSNLYDTEEFSSIYNYNGDLGSKVKNNGVQISIWAPLNVKVEINFYNTGHLSETPQVQNIPIDKSNPGVFTALFTKDKIGKYYTLSIYQIGKNKIEIVDPYASGAGLNGNRAYIADFAAIDKELEFDSVIRPKTVSSWSDYMVYELHVRDLTSHSSWTGDETKRNNFLGVSEKNTVYNGMSTGFDHIQNLGVNAIQLLPIFDNGIIEESNPSFNWGYMPKNYNVLEGSYSSDPYDGEVRIKEFKQMMKELSDAEHNMRVIMDVVYNHTGSNYNSNFHQILPGYFHRMYPDSDPNYGGTFRDGSGCLNATASERPMMRKYMIDSLKFWATEYKLSGFRFDLMGLHDVETMNLIVDMLKEIDPTIIVYGEPWDGSGGNHGLWGNYDDKKNGNYSTLPANYDNRDILKAGSFNDITRNAIKGDGDSATPGWIQESSTLANDEHNRAIRYGLSGGYYNSFDGSFYKLSSQDPNRTINYVSAHDNLTLYDKLATVNPSATLQQLADLSYLASSVPIVSQGVLFIHAGEELLRSKVKDSKDWWTSRNFEKDSYDKPDSVNQIRWDLVQGNAIARNTVKKYSELINIRKNNSALTLDTSVDIDQYFAYYYQYAGEWINNNVVSYFAMNKNNVTYLIASSKVDCNIYLGTKNYQILNDLTKNGSTIVPESVGSSLSIKANSTLVLRESNVNTLTYKIESLNSQSTDYYLTNSSIYQDYLPENKGYTFDGWYLDNLFLNPVIWSGSKPSYTLTSNKTFYGKVTPKSTMVTVNPGGATSGSIPNFSVNYDSLPTELVIPTYPGHTFLGYYYGDTQYYNSLGIPVKKWDIENETVELTAKWSIISYVIRYYYDKTSPTLFKDEIVEYGSTINYFPTLEDLNVKNSSIDIYSQILEHWENERGLVFDESVEITDNFSLYPILTPITKTYVTIIFEDKQVIEKEVPINQLVNTIIPTKFNNKVFKGFYTDANFKDRINPEQIVKASGTVIYAKYEPKTNLLPIIIIIGSILSAAAISFGIYRIIAIKKNKQGIFKLEEK